MSVCGSRAHLGLAIKADHKRRVVRYYGGPLSSTANWNFTSKTGRRTRLSNLWEGFLESVLHAMTVQRLLLLLLYCFLESVLHAMTVQQLLLLLLYCFYDLIRTLDSYPWC
jgi:hypothetical protein